MTDKKPTTTKKRGVSKARLLKAVLAEMEEGGIPPETSIDVLVDYIKDGIVWEAMAE